MKTIPLRSLPDPQAPEFPEAAMRTVDVIRNIVRQPRDRQAGVSIDEMRRGIRILDALDVSLDARATDILQLEDADYDELRAKTLGMSWGMVDKRLLRIIDDILDAQSAPSLNGVAV